MALRGRQRFAILRPALVGASGLLGLLPRVVARALLGALRHVPGQVGLGLRYPCVRRLAAACGDNVGVYGGVYLRDLDRLELGSNIKIGELCFIGASGGVRIEDDVSLAHGCSVLTEEHDHTAPGPLRDTPLRHAPVTIERGVWVGAGTRILAGVTIGADSAIGAGSVVTRDVPPGSIAAGVPARVLKPRVTDGAGA